MWQHMTMKTMAWPVLSAALLICGAGFAHAQPAPDVAASQQSGAEKPAQVVTVFLSEPSGFAALEMDGAPFGDLSMPADFPGVWSEPAGTKKLTVKAPGCEDTEVALKLAAGHTTILFFSIEGGSAGKKGKISVKALAPRILPPKAGSKKIYALVAPDSAAVSAKLMRNGEKFTDVQLVPGKLELVGEGETVLKVGPQVLISGNPASSGNYVFILVPDGAQGIRSLAYSDILPDPEGQTVPRQ